jgi:hypothetical protein
MTTTAALIPAHDPAEPAVALLTALAATADLSDGEYRQIYDHVAQGRSLRNIALALRSNVTFGWWAQYASGERHLDRDRKNELRVWAGLPPLPPTPVEAVAAAAHPDAAVYQVGADIANRIVLIGSDVPAVNLTVNGNCAALPYTPHVTSVTGHSGRSPRKTIHLSPETWKCLSAARESSGLTWDEFLARLA